MTKTPKYSSKKITKEIIIIGASTTIWYYNYIGEVFDAVEYDNAFVIDEERYVRKEDCLLTYNLEADVTLHIAIAKIRQEINN